MLLHLLVGTWLHYKVILYCIGGKEVWVQHRIRNTASLCRTQTVNLQNLSDKVDTCQQETQNTICVNQISHCGELLSLEERCVIICEHVY